MIQGIRYLTFVAVLILAAFWLTPTVTRILDSIWPLLALCLAMAAGALAISVTLRALAPAIHAMRPELAPIEVIQPAGPLAQFDRVVSAIVDSDSEDPAAIHADRWRVALCRFCMLADHVGFGVNDLCPRYMSKGIRTIYIALLQAPIEIVIVDYRGSRWAPDWSYRGLRAALTHGVIQPPYPAGRPPYFAIDGAGAASQASKASKAGQAGKPGQLYSTGASYAAR